MPITMSFAISLVAFAAFTFFSARRITRYLHILQQDDYSNRRFLGWMFRTLAFDRHLTLGLMIIAVVQAFFGFYFEAWWWGLFAAIYIAGRAMREPDPRRDAKKKFVMTKRARRIFLAAWLPALLLGIVAAVEGQAAAWIIPVQLLPLLLVIANACLSPVEARIQKKFWMQAHKRLMDVAPTVVGITGSFGKTSVKHILGHILEMNARTYFTPGSVNTPMGVARVLREEMPSDCKYLLVEMGAYGVGSIEKLCKLAPPDFGIITAIGEAHYERYKSLDAVAHAKFELAEAVTSKPSGQLVIHENVLEQPYARAFVAKHPGKFIVVGSGPRAEVIVGEVSQTRAMLSFTVTWKNETFDLMAPLFGTHHADNIAVAFASAVTLGVPPDRVMAALHSVPQITHRLEVKPQPDGTIYIDDAFNSNPRGFVSALETMAALSDEGRKILVTPGVAELGEKNDEVHKALGEKAAKLVDVAIVVRSDRIPGFAAGFRAANGNELHEVANLTEAQGWLKHNAKPKDIILFENDLPDVLETRLKL